MILAGLYQFAQHNQLFVGMGAATVAGAAMTKLRSIPGTVASWLRRGFVVEVSVNSSESSFPVLDRWLAQHPATKKTRSLAITTQSGGDETGEPWFLTPGPGYHWFFWRRRLVWMSRKRLEVKEVGRPTNEIVLSMVSRSVKPMWGLVEEAYALQAQESGPQIRVWRSSYWTTVAGRQPRPLDTMTLRGGQIEALLADFAWFEDNRDWYITRGIPYRRGYLFAGQPGTGKSSLVLALGTHLSRPVCLINLSSLSGDADLEEAISEAPRNAIILIEDIDCAMSAKSRVKPDGADKKPETGTDERVTQAGLLNALDGLMTPEGRIFILTTNHPEKLDPALIRPGRADVHVNFGALGPDDQVRMANRFYPDGGFEPVSFNVAPASLQAAFMRFPTDPQGARRLLLGTDALQAAA